MSDLTEQFNHGLLPEDRLYYYRFKGEPDVQITTQYGLYCEEADNKKEIEVIDFVPIYSEYLAKKEGEEIIAELEAENAQLKELLKEIRSLITEQVFGSPKLQLFKGTFDNKLLTKIDEVLK